MLGYIGHFNEWHTEVGVADALEKYTEVHRYDINSLDREKYTKREYPLTLCSVPHKHPIPFWRQQRVKVAHYFDLVQGYQNRPQVYYPTLREFDLVMSPDGFGGYEGINRIYMRQGYNHRWYYPVEGKKKFDVSFIGSIYGERGNTFKGVRLTHFNQHRGEAHARVCAESKIMLCPAHRVPYYWSNRVYLHLGCRGFVLHQYVEGMEEFFTDGEHLVYFTNDLKEKVRFYLAHPDERDRIAGNGYNLVRKRDTWEARVVEMWPLVSSVTPTGRPASGCSSGSS